MSKANGALFKNTRKQGKQPDYTGKVTINAEVIKGWQQALNGQAEVQLDMAGWMKTSNNGLTYISLLVSPPFKKDAGEQPRRANKIDDDVPW